MEKISIKDPVLLALYNEPLGKFVTDNNPQYRFVSLLSEILLAPEQENVVEDYAGFYHYKQQFDESIRVLVRSILCTLFYIAGSDNDKDIMRFFDESNEDKKMVLKRIIRDDANYINSKVDHSLRILKDASNYILTETKKDPSFIQKLLNKSYLENLLSDTALLHTRLKTMQSFVKRMRVIKDKLIGISYRVLDNTSEGIDELNKMMNSSAYQQLLLLVRDANSEGDQFFKHFQQVFGFFADYANSKKAAFAEALDNLEKNMTNGFRAVEVYLKIVPKMAEKLEDYRKNYSHVTLIEEGMSEFYKGLIHRISQIYVDFFPSQERGKIVYKHEKELDELLLIYKPMYGDRIRGITDPIIDNNNLFQGNSEYNLTRYIAKDDKKRDPDAIYHYYKEILMIRSCAKALADFYGSLLDDNTSFDVTGLEDEIRAVMKRLKAIYNYSRNKIAELND
ncbi:MAG: hypothetical protein FVQ80_16600 [Planctomycetes bacterium]|nr:hypothetical protein [Planctomycetota bacterium]